MSYSTDKIRNVCLLGHGGSGKTSLVESILFTTKSIDRLGKVSDGNTACDYDQEEIKRGISISAATVFVDYNGTKINIIDTPGYFDFAGEVCQAVRVADAGIIVQPAKGAVTVGTEKAWKSLSEQNLPKMFYISKIDEENGDYDAIFAALREKFGHTVCPVVIPWGKAPNIEGVIDIAHEKAYKLDGSEAPVPADMASEVSKLRDVLMETVAEASEELMEKFFSGEAFTKEEINSGIAAGVKELSMVPVVCGSGFTAAGTKKLLEIIAEYMPSPADRVEKCKDAAGETVELKCSEGGSTVLFVFKTTSDQYGKFSYFKVLSGKADADMTVVNSRTGTNEKLGHIFNMLGKKNIEVKTVGCGDIGAVSKLVETKTGDTLCTPGKVFSVEPIAFPEPCYSMAIAPKTKGQEDKLAGGLNKLAEEDLTFSVENNVETRQMVISGVGDIQIDVICSKLKAKFGVEVELSPMRVPYREKIRKKVEKQGRHKKQSGGHGQFGDVWIRFEPQDETDDLIFAEEVFGGSVPKNFFPAVEKGLRESISKGVLAGYPVVGLKATLYDGSYHPVDSSEMAFKTAASLAYKAALPDASPVILEPIGLLKVVIPDSYMGDVIGDLNKRRGRVNGMNPVSGGLQEVEAEVPMAEMSTYAIDLRSMTQGRGSFSFKFIRYDETPAPVQQKIIEEAKALAVEE